MKKKLYILILCCLSTACDRTENAEILEGVFFGRSQGNRAQSEYERMEPNASVYSQEFSDSNNCEGWTIGTDQYGMRGVENGQYFIQAKTGFYSWRNFEIDDTHDFQIEVYMACNFMQGGTSLGLVFGVNPDEKSYGAVLFDDNSSFYIGFYTGSKWEAWHNMKTTPYTEMAYRNAFHLYTIRKVGNKMSFFLDKKFLCSTDYMGKLSNIGFSLSKNGIIGVDYIHVNYIKTREL